MVERDRWERARCGLRPKGDSRRTRQLLGNRCSRRLHATRWRITQLVETVQGSPTTRGFTYDSAGRLSTVTENSVLVRSYGYDGNGNRLSLTGPGLNLAGTYDAQDRLLSYGGTMYAYTANGELQEKVVGTDTTRYTYDQLGNLTQVRLPDAMVIEYVIDGQSAVGKKVNGVLQRGGWQSQLAPAAVGWRRPGASSCMRRAQRAGLHGQASRRTGSSWIIWAVCDWL
jgi:YD repeat-containing protein